MPIQQTKKQSDLEKRLKLLRKQIYGKETLSTIKYQAPVTEITEINSSTTKLLIPSTDLTYLRQDLLKISILSGIALGAQIIFYLMYF